MLIKEQQSKKIQPSLICINRSESESDPMDCSPWNSPGQNTGMGSLSLLQGIFPTQGSNPGLLCYRWILYQLSYKGSPRILEWVAHPFSGDLPDPGIKPESPALQIDSLPTELSGKPVLTEESPNLFKNW